MNDNELRAAILNHIRKIHYITAVDSPWGEDGTQDVCAECMTLYPCRTVLTLDGDLNA